MARDPMTSSLLPYAPERDVYRLLQVEPNASDQQIAVACRRLALAFHPDYNRSPRAHEEMQIVNAVRSLLSDPHSRAAYDGARRRFLYRGERHRGHPSAGPRPRRPGSRERCRCAAIPPSRRTRSMAPRPAPAQITPFEPYTPWMGLLHRRARRTAAGPGGRRTRHAGGDGAGPLPELPRKGRADRSLLRVVRHLGRPDGEAVRRLRLRGCGQARSGSVRSGSIPSSPMARASSSRLAAPVMHRPCSAA